MRVSAQTKGYLCLALACACFYLALVKLLG